MAINNESSPLKSEGAIIKNQDKYRALLNSMQRETHVKRVLRHLLDYGSITSIEAFAEYGCTRLSATIYTLKHTHNVPIVALTEHSKNRYGHNISYARYTLKENDND